VREAKGVALKVVTRNWLVSGLVGLAVGAAVFAPVGLYLQWAVPGDGPYEYVYSLFSLPLLVLATVLLRLRRTRTWVRGFVITALLSLFVLVQVWLYVPQLSRRVWQWRGLHTLLVRKSLEVEDALSKQGIPTDRPISRAQVAHLEQELFMPKPTYDFFLPRRRVTVRILKTVPPYVGVDYGGGRNCRFDLDSMVATHCD